MVRLIRLFVIVCAIIAVVASPVLAWIYGATPTPGKLADGVNTQVPGSSPTDGTYYLNAFKSAGGYTFGAGDTPAKLDDDGYPVATLSSDLPFNVIFSSSVTGTSQTWVLKSPSTRTYKLFANGGFCNISATGCTATSNTFTSNVTTNAGQSCRVTFNWCQNPGNLSFKWPAGAFYAPGSGDVALMRASDEAAYDAGAGINPPYTPIAVNRKQELAPKYYRVMPEVEGGNANFTNLANWNYRIKTSNFSWAASRFPVGAWGGAVTGTDAYTVSPPPDDTGTLVNNEVIQGAIANPGTTITVSGAVSNGGNVQLTVNATATLSNSQTVWVNQVGGTTEANGIQTILTVDDATHITINVPFVHAYTSGGAIGTQTLTVSGRSYGTIFIANGAGGVTGTQSLTQVAAVPSTFTYNSLLNRWMYATAGVTRATPIEVLVAAANVAGTGLWLNIPMYADLNYVSNIVAYCRDHLVNDLHLEKDNETWNFAFPVGTYMTAMGDALGWSISNLQDQYGFYALSVAQMAQTARSVWTTTRSRSSLHIVMAIQAFGDVGVTTTNRFNGTQLNGGTFPLYCAYVGGSWSGGVCTGDPGYNAAPNRPIDFSDTVSYAPYTTGPNIVGPDTGTYSTSNIGQAAFLQNLVNLYATGTLANINTALALIDADGRQGATNVQTVTIGGDTKTFTIAGTNYSAGNKVVFTTTGTTFTNISLSLPYFVINPVGSTFQVSLTSGGSAVTGISGGTGTQSVGHLGNFSLMGYAADKYPGWETAVASYDSARAGFTPALPPLAVESYEGGIELTAPTATDCANLGVTLNGSNALASAALVSLVATYKYSTTYGRSIILSHFREFMGIEAGYFNFGTLPHSTTPTQFAFDGAGSYGLLSGDIYSVPYDTWYGFKLFP